MTLMTLMTLISLMTLMTLHLINHFNKCVSDIHSCYDARDPIESNNQKKFQIIFECARAHITILSVSYGSLHNQKMFVRETQMHFCDATGEIFLI